MVPESQKSWMIKGDTGSLEAVERLGRLLDWGRVCGLIGSGVPAHVGYPTWGGLLDELAQELALTNQLSDQSLLSLRAQRDYLWRAEEYRQHLGERQYHTILSRMFKDSRYSQPMPSLLLDIIGLNFKHIFTTNYDLTLERTHQQRYRESPAQLDWDNQSEVRSFLASIDTLERRTYVHLHGKHNQPQSIVLTYRDYVDRYIRSDERSERLFVLFSTECFAFVGFSLEDPDFMQILRQVNSRLGVTDDPTHFAILPANEQDNLSLERRRLRGKFDVDPIFYLHKPHDEHEGFGKLVSTLLYLQAPPQPEPVRQGSAE
jgi:hypothetical protein